MSHVKAIVEVYDPKAESTSVQSFARSPVRIGRGHSSGLRLDDEGVAPIHGEIWFGPEFLSFGNLAAKTWLDGHQLRLGALVPLTMDATLIVGPYRLRCYRLTTGAASGGDVLSSAETRVCPTAVFDLWPPRVTKFLARALSVLTEFADALVELRRDMVLPADSILFDIDDPDEILAYLLDPTSPDERVAELREDLTALVQQKRRSGLSGRRGSA